MHQRVDAGQHKSGSLSVTFDSMAVELALLPASCAAVLLDSPRPAAALQTTYNVQYATAMTKRRILLAEDHQVMREGLRMR
jgi:hypothetical protein